MTITELMNNIFLDTDSIKMNHLIVNYLTGASYDIRAIDDAVNLLDSPLTNNIDIGALNFENTPLAICRILYTAGLWRSLCDFYFILYARPLQTGLDITRDVKEIDEREIIVRYVYNDAVIRMTVDDSRTVIRIKQIKTFIRIKKIKFEEVRF